MLLSELVGALDAIAPLRHAESWDNVGLLAGDPAQAVTRVLLTIDYTIAVAEEGARERCDAVVAYHPPIFEGLKRIAASSPVGFALRRGIALYSPHTALDAAIGGTNDVLADIVGMETRAPIRASGSKDREHKLVTFAPVDAADAVSRALFEAGAGKIGRYSSCSFRTKGAGTFFGEAGTSPTVGEPGRLETADEIKIETVLPLARVGAVVAALRAAHPYEEPAFDLVRLAAPPEAGGMGRIGGVAETTREELFARVKAGLGIDAMLIAGPLTGRVKRVAVAAGACGDLLSAAIAQSADVMLTGEVRHHDALAAAAAGVTVICALHSRSERATLTRLRDTMKARLPALDVVVSQSDADPFVIR